MEEKVFIIKTENKPLFIYIGPENSVEKGAIGTHTAGIFNALSASGYFGRTVFIGGQPTAETNIPLNADENFLIDINVGAATTIAGRMYRRYILFKKISAITKSLLQSHANGRVIVYTRYSLILTFILLLLLKKSLVRQNVTFIPEYNDIATDQLVFVNKYRASFIAKFIRTNPAILWLIERTEAYVFAKSTFVVVMTQKLGEYVVGLSKTAETLVLPNATSIDLIARAKTMDKYETRKELGLAPDCFYLAHVGTLTFWDGLDHLLRGMALCRGRTELRLLVIGFGDALAAIQKQARDLDLDKNVLFFPSMPHDRAFKYLIATDIVPILKTINTYQLSPIKYYETLAAGKPLITTDIPYINEIGEFPFGKVVSCPPQAQETAQAIDYFHDNRGKLGQWKNDILAYASHYHTWDMRARKLLDKISGGN